MDPKKVIKMINNDQKNGPQSREFVTSQSNNQSKNNVFI